MASLVDSFIEGLHHLERSGDPEKLVALFSDEATVSNPLVRHEGRGADGARSFWQSYRNAFTEIESSFRLVVETDAFICLEWTSEGAAGEGSFRYGGVSVMEHHAGKIASFRSYFDPRHIQGGHLARKTVEHEQPLAEAQPVAADHPSEGGYG